MHYVFILHPTKNRCTEGINIQDNSTRLTEQSKENNSEEQQQETHNRKAKMTGWEILNQWEIS